MLFRYDSAVTADAEANLNALASQISVISATSSEELAEVVHRSCLVFFSICRGYLISTAIFSVNPPPIVGAATQQS